jgi:hypothetical protein
MIERFRSAYQGRNSPRIAILWNRVLSDQIDAQKYHVERETGAFASGTQQSAGAVVGGAAAVRRFHGGAVAGEYGAAVSQSATTHGEVSVKDRVSADLQAPAGERAPVLSERDRWYFEKGFTDPFVHAGAKLVDRNTVVRLAGEGGASDQQRAEMSGLRRQADLFVEILQSADPESPSGYLFRATAKDVSSGQIVADVTSDGAEPGASTEFVATNRGFEPRPSRKAEAANGAAVAMALMSELVEAWAAR